MKKLLIIFLIAISALQSFGQIKDIIFPETRFDSIRFKKELIKMNIDVDIQLNAKRDLFTFKTDSKKHASIIMFFLFVNSIPADELVFKFEINGKYYRIEERYLEDWIKKSI